MKMPAAWVFIDASSSVVGGTFGTGTSSGQIITLTCPEPPALVSSDDSRCATCIR